MKQTVVIVLGMLVVVAALFISADESMAPGYAIGDSAADFKLPNIDGKLVSMADYKDAKGFIVIFTCNTCPFAKAYEDRIVALDAKYRPKQFPVIAINPNDLTQQPDDSMEHMKARAKEKGFTFPYLRDESQEVAKMYGATKTPHLYLLSNNGGKYKVEYIGAIDDNPNDADNVNKRYVENAVDALLAGKSPAVKEIRAIGCTIKWKD
jgi:peroxiredoxin